MKDIKMKSIYIVVPFVMFCSSVYGVVFTQDVTIAKNEVENKATVASYVSNTYNTLTKVNQTMAAVDNLKKLQGLQKLNGMSELCRLCDMSDLKQLQQYSSSIDSDLCSQFSIAYQNLTGITNSAKSLQDIMGLLTTNPQAAMLSLQQASLAASQTANSTLGQIQTLQAQAVQRELAKEKYQETVARGTASKLQAPPL